LDDTDSSDCSVYFYEAIELAGLYDVSSFRSVDTAAMNAIQLGWKKAWANKPGSHQALKAGQRRGQGRP